MSYTPMGRPTYTYSALQLLARRALTLGQTVKGKIAL